MQKLLTYFMLLSASVLLTGFSWGFGSGDSCRNALELAWTLEGIRDETQLRQTEARILSLCPDGGAGHYVSGLQLERVGNLDGAISEYRKALQQERSFPLASGNLGLLYAQKGMNDEASVELARGLSSVPNPKYHKAMARILAERKVYPLAIYHYTEAARELTRDASVFTGLADVYAASGQPEKALEEYRRALVADPNSEAAHIGIASIYLTRNEQDKALESLKKAETGNPHNREIHLKMAAIYEKKGDATSAEYQYLLGGKPKTATVATSQQKTTEGETISGDLARDIELIQASIKKNPASATLYEKLGNLYRSGGKDTEAIAAYKEAAHLNSTSSEVFLNLGILLGKRSLLDEAVVAYKQAIRIKPDNADAHLRLADVQNSRGLYQEAVTHYGEFLKLKPDSPDIQLKLARIFARNKENGLAIDAYIAFLKHSPDNVEANREIAALYRVKGANEKAVMHYTKVLAKQKDDMDTRNALVSIYVKNKQYDEITLLLKGTAELFPDDPNNHYKLGLINEFRKDYESAIANYKKAIEVKADHARSLNALGRLYMKTGRINEAKEMLEAAKKADPTLEETTVLLNNIRDEFNPEPRKISKKKKGKSKKGKKSSKTKKTTKTKKATKTKKPTKTAEKKITAPKKQQ
jgi:tetratricopeptide (TPR) repeat protein